MGPCAGSERILAGSEFCVRLLRRSVSAPWHLPKRGMQVSDDSDEANNCQCLKFVCPVVATQRVQTHSDRPLQEHGFHCTGQGRRVSGPSTQPLKPSNWGGVGRGAGRCRRRRGRRRCRCRRPGSQDHVCDKDSDTAHDEAWLARAAFNRLADAPQWALVEAAAVSEHKAAGRVLRFCDRFAILFEDFREWLANRFGNRAGTSSIRSLWNWNLAFGLRAVTPWGIKQGVRRLQPLSLVFLGLLYAWKKPPLLPG